MLSKLRARLTYANVVSTLCLFLVVGGGTAYATHLVVNSSDIVDGEVKTPDLATDAVTQEKVRDGAIGRFELQTGGVIREKLNNGAVDSSKLADNAVSSGKVLNNSLNDEDVGERTLVNFEASIGLVRAQNCKAAAVSGIGGRGDHLVLTASIDNTAGGIIYDALFDPESDATWIEACNVTGADINDGNTNFNLLIIDAQ